MKLKPQFVIQFSDEQYYVVDGKELIKMEEDAIVFDGFSGFVNHGELNLFIKELKESTN